MTTITTTVNKAVTLGSGGYDSTLVIDASGSVASPSGSPNGAIGVYSNLADGSLTIYGSVTGGAGASVTDPFSQASAGTGGAGVDFTAGVIKNYGGIAGGQGGTRRFLTTGYVAFAGGDGVDLSGSAHLYNETGGTITGGGAGKYGSATGAVGVSLSGTSSLSNTGTITGGAVAKGTAGVGVLLQGNSTFTSGSGGSIVGGSVQLQHFTYGQVVTGGAGVSIMSSGASFTNEAGSSITGGSGYDGGSGGVGLYIAANGSAENYGSISGSNNAAGASLASSALLYNDGKILGGQFGVSGGSAGVVLQSSATLNTGANSDIVGGSGNGAGGAGVELLEGASAYNGGQITGGVGAAQNPAAGGAGASVAASATLYNESSGTITGGGGGENNDYGTKTGGTGGVGVDLVGAGFVTDQGSIVGGAGGNNTYRPGIYYYYGVNYFPHNGYGRPGTGGAGANVVKGSKLTNYGHITGGNGGTSYYTAGGSGGVGVYVNGGTLTNAGTISGGSGTYGGNLSGQILYGGGTRGYGASGLAVKFGSVAGTLVVDPGAVFNGNVAANSAVKDVLQLAGTGGTLSGFGSQFYGFSTLSFATHAQWTVAGYSAAFENPLSIQGFALNDKLDLTDLTLKPHGSYVFNTTTDVLTITEGSTTLNLDFNSSFTGDHFVLTADGNGTDVLLETGPACFTLGTRILTAAGERTVESLRIGDAVMTRSGVAQPIRWIGRRSYTRSFCSDNADVLPVLFRRGSLGQDAPTRDLRVSPEHAFYIDGMLIAARDLVNGNSILQENVGTDLTYVHLEFESHEIIYAEGAPVESFVDDDSRRMFDNAAEYSLLYPGAERRVAPVCAPRIDSGWELASVRAKLAGYTAVPGMARATSAGALVNSPAYTPAARSPAARWG